MILHPEADRRIFDAVKTAVRPRLRTWNNRERSMRDELPVERLGSIPKTTPPLIVCDGWTEPRHPRKVLGDGDPARVSHGMCPACQKAMEEQ